MDAYQFTNNAKSTLASGIADSDLSLDVKAGEGTLFPTAAGAAFYMCTLVDTSGNREIIKVTARSTDAFTIVRAQEGTAALAFSADDKCELRVTAAYLEAVVDAVTDLNGEELILDADGDTSITADTDDQIDIKIAGVDQIKFTAAQQDFSSAGAIQMSIKDGSIEPGADNDVDLGSSSEKFKDAFIAGDVNLTGSLIHNSVNIERQMKGPTGGDVEFTGLDETSIYKLKFFAYGSATIGLVLRVNDDSGANYSYIVKEHYEPNTLYLDETEGATSIPLIAVVGAPSRDVLIGEFFIGFDASNNDLYIHGTVGNNNAGSWGTVHLTHISGVWHGGAVLSSLKLIDSNNNFTAGYALLEKYSI